MRVFLQTYNNYNPNAKLDIITHELLHGLGIVPSATYFDSTQIYLPKTTQNNGYPFYPSDPYTTLCSTYKKYVDSQIINDSFNDRFVLNIDNTTLNIVNDGTRVPLEDGGGSGTLGFHFEKSGYGYQTANNTNDFYIGFYNELMIGFANNDHNSIITGLTLQAAKPIKEVENTIPVYKILRDDGELLPDNPTAQDIETIPWWTDGLTIDSPNIQGYVLYNSSNVFTGQTLYFNGTTDLNKIPRQIECLRHTDENNRISVSLLDNKLIFDDKPYDANKNIGLSTGTYHLFVPQGQSFGIIRYDSSADNGSIKITEGTLVETLTVQSNGRTYEFYTGNINIEVSGDFGTISYNNFNQDYDGVRNRFVYSANCDESQGPNIISRGVEPLTTLYTEGGKSISISRNIKLLEDKRQRICNCDSDSDFTNYKINGTIIK